MRSEEFFSVKVCKVYKVESFLFENLKIDFTLQTFTNALN